MPIVASFVTADMEEEAVTEIAENFGITKDMLSLWRC